MNTLDRTMIEQNFCECCTSGPNIKTIAALWHLDDHPSLEQRLENMPHVKVRVIEPTDDPKLYWIRFKGCHD